MKLNRYLTALAVVIAGLLGWFFYAIAEGYKNDVVVGVCGGLSLAATLVPIVGVHFEDSSKAVNSKVLAGVVFVLLLVVNLAFAIISVKMPYYLILTLLIVLIYICVLHAINTAKEQ